MKKVAIIAAIVGAGVLLWRKFSPTAPLGIKLLFNGVRLSSGKLIADFKATNPTPVTSIIQTMQGTLLVNGNSLGPLTGFNPVTVPPSSSGTAFSLTVPVSIVNALIDIADLIAGNTGTPALFQVDGFAAVDQRVLPLDLTYQIV